MLQGKLAVITGAGGGLGRAMALRYAQLGATVVVSDIKKEGGVETCRLLPKVDRLGDSPLKTAEHNFVQCDVSSGNFVRQMTEYIVHKYGTAPHIVINNAGITMDARLHRMTEEQFDWVVAANLKSVFLMTQHMSEAMIDAKVEGSIINISSIVGKTGNFGQCNYAASKAGVIGLTKTAALELAKYNIRVNAVLPGFIETAMTAKMPEKVFNRIISMVPLKRLGQPSDIAEACVYLGGDMSKFVTGISLEVAGGMGI